MPCRNLSAQSTLPIQQHLQVVLTVTAGQWSIIHFIYGPSPLHGQPWPGQFSFANAKQLLYMQGQGWQLEVYCTLCDKIDSQSVNMKFWNCIKVVKISCWLTIRQQWVSGTKKGLYIVGNPGIIDTWKKKKSLGMIHLSFSGWSSYIAPLASPSPSLPSSPHPRHPGPVFDDPWG
jgi:hypothetical protein